jgi:hypothetical protein
MAKQNRQIQILQKAAAKALEQANYFHLQAQEIHAHPEKYLEPEGEFKFYRARSLQFDEQAGRIFGKIADLKERQS